MYKQMFSKKIIKILFAAILALCMVIFIFILIFTRQLKRDRYLIPEGYTGWILVHYSVSDAPVLNIEDGFRLIKIDEKGEAFTSSEIITGEGYKDEYYYISGDKNRTAIPQKYFGAGGGTIGKLDKGANYKSICYFFWLGTTEQFEKMGKPSLNKKCE